MASWLNPYLEDLIVDWGELGHAVSWAHRHEGQPPADFCFCLSYELLLPAETRALFQHTLVVHESDLPQGKGWSPLTWQILEGRNCITVTLFEAADGIDSGVIYAQRRLEFQGHELVSELRAAQAGATLDLCRWFVDRYPASLAQARPQVGEGTLFPRRRLDPDKTLAEQFNLLRVVDKERYPAYFEHQGRFYRLDVDLLPNAYL